MKVLYNIINGYTQRFSFPKKGWKYFKLFHQQFGLANKTYLKKIFNGLWMYVDTIDHIQSTIFWYGHYGGNSSVTWQSFVKEDSIVLDVGANIGYYGLIAANKASEGQVYCFEPVSFIRQKLLENILLNKFTNVKVLPYCVSNTTLDSILFLATPDNIGMSGLKVPENFSGTTETVQTIILDEWLQLNKINSVDIIKIDIEGAEIMALQGMSNILQQYKPAVFIEIVASHLEKFGNTMQEIYTVFSNYNYQSYQITNQNELTPIHKVQEGDDIIFIPEGYKLPSVLKIIL